MSATRTGSPITQGFISVLDDRMKYSSEEALTMLLIATFSAARRPLHSSTTSAQVDCLTIDGWSAADGALIVERNLALCRYKPVIEICACHYASHKNGIKVRGTGLFNCRKGAREQPHHQLGEALCAHHNIWKWTVIALVVELLTNYVGLIRCVVHSYEVYVNEVFLPETHWEMYMELVNKVTKYFKYRTKAKVQMREKQLKVDITKDHIHRLKYEI